MGKDSFSIYWHGVLERKEGTLGSKVKDYSVTKIFSFTYAQAQYDSFEKWLSKEEIIYKVPEGSIEDYYEPKETTLYRNVDGDQSRSFSQAYAYPIYTEAPEKRPRPGEKVFPISMQEFFLDLLYDIYHSSIFQAHPNYFDLIDFLNAVPLSKAVILKAQYYWANIEYARAKATEKHNEERIAFNQERMEEYRSNWLKFVRSPLGDKTTKLSAWFLGVEKEHDLIYSNHADIQVSGVSESKKTDIDPSLRKEAEDSLQWLLTRYNISGAFAYQVFTIYKRVNLWIFLISAAVLFGLIVQFYFKPFRIFKEGLLLLDRYNFLFCVLFFASLALLCGIFSIFVIERLFFHGVFRNIWNLIHNEWCKRRGQIPKRSWDANHSWYDTLASIPKLLAMIKPKILLASGAVWAFLFASNINALWDLNFLFEDGREYAVLLILFFAFMFIISRLNTYIAKNRKKIEKPLQGTPINSTKHRHYLLLSLLSLSAIWLLFFSTMNQYVRYFIVFCEVSFIVFILSDQQKWFVKITSRAVIVMTLATLYSFGIGVIGMSINGKEEMTKPERLAYYDNLMTKNSMFSNVFKHYCYKNHQDSMAHALGLDSISHDSMVNLDAKERLKIWNAFKKREDISPLEEIYTHVIPNLYHKYGLEKHKSDKTCLNKEIGIFKEMGLELEIFVLIHPLIFFTFISVAIGLLLEMGLRIEDTGVDFG
jgi:hypothetical protein